jgi:hypothetical protein
MPSRATLKLPPKRPSLKASNTPEHPGAERRSRAGAEAALIPVNMPKFFLFCRYNRGSSSPRPSIFQPITSAARSNIRRRNSGVIAVRSTRTLPA